MKFKIKNKYLKKSVNEIGWMGSVTNLVLVFIYETHQNRNWIIQYHSKN